MKLVKTLAVTAAALLAFGASAGEKQAVNGDFKGTPIPTGWNQNRPNNWDSAGTFKVAPIAELEKNSVLMASKTKKMHLYTKQAIKVAAGDSIIMKAMVRGKGMARMGAYCYPQASLNSQGFKVTGEWQEKTVTINITSTRIKEVRLLVAADPGSTAEYVNLTVTHKKKK